MKPMRIEPEVTERYRKDPEEEHFLRRLNEALAPHEDAAYREVRDPPPTLHIIGVPRSGTTLLYQLIASHLGVGYVNHLVAAFWRAPVHGVRLSKKLLPPGGTSSLESEFGRTAAIHEPHEFGYFWSELLGYVDMQQRDEAFEAGIDWRRVRLVLGNIAGAFGGPFAFKSFLLGWHVARMLEALPNTCFVRIRRDPVQNAVSLLGMRRRFLGSAERWASLRPREYAWLRHEPVWRQVAGQVYYLERAHAEQIRRAGGRNVLEVRYEELCRDPADVLERVRALLAANGADAPLLSSPPARLEERRVDPAGDPVHARIEREVEAFYAGRRGRGDVS